MGRGIRIGMGEVRWGEGGKAIVEGCVMGVFRKVKSGHSDWCCFCRGLWRWCNSGGELEARDV